MVSLDELWRDCSQMGQSSQRATVTAAFKVAREKPVLTERHLEFFKKMKKRHSFLTLRKKTARYHPHGRGSIMLGGGAFHQLGQGDWG